MENHQFKEIYDHNEAFVRKSLFWLLQPEAVDDVLQEVFVKVWSKIHQFNEKSSLKTWIYRITMNTAYDHLRKEKRLSLVQAPLQETSENLDQQLSHQEAIRLAISKLPAKQKLCFVMFYIQDLSIKDIAKAADISEGTVKSRLHGSRETVQGHLKKLGINYG